MTKYPTAAGADPKEVAKAVFKRGRRRLTKEELFIDRTGAAARLKEIEALYPSGALENPQTLGDTEETPQDS